MDNLFKRIILKLLILACVYYTLVDAKEMYGFIIGYIVANLFIEIEQLFKDNE